MKMLVMVAFTALAFSVPIQAGQRHQNSATRIGTRVVRLTKSARQLENDFVISDACRIDRLKK